MSERTDTTPRLFGAATTNGVALVITAALPTPPREIASFSRAPLPAEDDPADDTRWINFVVVDDAADPADVLAELAAQMTGDEWSALIEAANDPNTPARLAAHIRTIGETS